MSGESGERSHLKQIALWLSKMPRRRFSLDNRLDGDDCVYVVIEDRVECVRIDGSFDSIEEAVEFAAGRINDDWWLE